MCLFRKGAIRTGHWKGIGKPGSLKLYDLAKDIGEQNDLAAQPPEIVAKLSTLMEQASTEPRSQRDDGAYGKGEKTAGEQPKIQN